MAYNRHIYSAFFSLALLFIVATAVLSLVPATVMAQSTSERLTAILEEAQDDYDMLMFDEAEEALQQGIRMAEREGLRGVDVANLYVMLGIVHHASQNERLAEAAFISAVETYPDVEIDPLYRTPALTDLMDVARTRAQPPSTDTPRADTTTPDDLESMVHEPLRRARAGQRVLFETQIPENLPVFRVYIYHRRYGEAEFVEAEMLPTDAVTFAFTLEAGEVRTTQLEYYIHAVNRSGEPIAESGRRTNPHRISVLGASGDDRATGPGDPVDPDLPIDPVEPGQPSTSGFYGMLVVGTDIGFLPGGTPPTAHENRTVSPGLAPAFAHTVLDLGWRISELNNIGLYFRWQFSPPQDFSQLPADRYDPNASFLQSNEECFGIGLPGDCLLGLKFQRVISTGVPEFYTSVGMGFGRVRNWLRLKQATSPENLNPICDGREVFDDPQVGQFCYVRDTVRTGWVHFGFGGGLYFPIMDNLDLVADSYLMVLVPDTSINLDLNLGIRFRL